MAQVTLISGPERRRRWSSQDRARILSAIEAPGAVVAEVARREDVCTSLVYKWRLAARKGSKRVEFTLVIVEPAPASSPPPKLAFAFARTPSDTDRGDLEGASVMIPIPQGSRVWLATGHTDMRKGFDGLALIVQETLRRDPHCGHLFVFRGRRGDLIKCLWWDGQGLCLFSKRLERGRFLWPSAAGGAVTISAAQLGYLLSGIDWRMPQETWRPSASG